LNAVRRQHGFSLVEIMVAVLLLAICAVPMGNAIRNGIAASGTASDKARELRCMKNMMETILAEPFYKLSDAALGISQPSSYSLPADGTCPVRQVFIAPYEDELGSGAGKDPVFVSLNDEARRELALLYITVAAPNGGYAFTTLVSR
jgi:prepilin-type N-terminal cleavage/methylation domain-containing protein